MVTNNSVKTIVDLNTVIFVVEWYRYHNDNIGFILNHVEDKSLSIRCTLNVEKVHLEENEVIIKNYDENYGIYQNLLKIGFIKPYNRRVNIGLKYGLVCKLNMDYGKNN